METDYFESSTISTILSWIFAIPFFLYLISWTINSLFEKFEDLPRINSIWLFVCIMLFSPFRYLLLQMILAISYMFQSGSAFFSGVLMAFYIPLVYGLLYSIGFSLPLMINFFVVHKIVNDRYHKFKLVISAILTPFFCLLGTYLFLLILPYAGYSTHWLKAVDVIRASNGPAWVYYKYVGNYFMPIQSPRYMEEVGSDLKTLYRTHIASIYLSKKQEMGFIKHAYPSFYKKLIEDSQKVNP